VFVVFRHVGSIRGVTAHGDQYIATAGDDGRIILWDKATGKSVSGSSHNDVVNNCAFSPGGQYLVTSSDDWTARLWSVPDLSLTAVLTGHGDDVTMSVFHPVDELIATASRDYFLRVYDFEARLVAKYGVITDVVWLDWTEDGRELVVLSDTGTMTRWPCSTAQPTHASGSSAAEHSGYDPAAPDGQRNCGQAVVAENGRSVKRLVMMLAVGAATIMPLAVGPTAHAATINCQHIGPIVGHPGMECICYVKDENDHRETFYAPGPKVP
jgi:WD40 repeat protein